MKKFEMTIAGETLKWEEKSHAQIFRNFWNHFLDKDIEKTIEIIELTNIRTSETEYFVAKNGSKKRNIPVKENYWIYTHLAPIAMQRVYDKFKSGMEGTYNKPEPKAPAPVDDLTAEPETTDDLAPEITNELMVIPPTDEQTELPIVEKTPEEITKDEIAQELFGTDFMELVPTQKRKVTIAYKESLKPKEETIES
jgi:hypothetical protein